MAAPLIIAGVAAAGLQTYGQIKSAQAQADAQERQAYLKNLQADELLSRESINEEIMKKKSAGLELQYGADFASTGRGGSGIGGILTIKSDLEENLALSRRDAEFKARMLRAGADIESSLASDMLTAGYIQGAGTMLAAAGQAYKSTNPAGASKELYS